jgi:hypothetical protein
MHTHLLTDLDTKVNTDIFKACFCITLISNLILYIAQPLDIVFLDAIASRSLMLTNLAAFLFAVILSLKEYLPYKTNQVFIICFMLIFSFASYFLSSSSGLYQYIIRIWCYMALPFYLLYIDFIRPSRRLINFVYINNLLASLLFILLSFSEYRYAGYEYYIGTNYAWLTLGYDNPNQTAIYLTITLIILISAISYYKSIMIRLFFLLDLIYIGWLILKTSSRTCILISILVLAAVLFYRRLKIPKLIVFIILLLPTIFLFTYPSLYRHGWFISSEYVGKEDYSSRSYIFIWTLRQLKNHYLFGDFGTYRLGNLHNGILSVLSSLGISGLLFFYIYYFRAYFYLLKHYIKSRTAYIAYIGLLAVFIHACTEGAFIAGGSVFAGSLSALIFLLKVEEKGV